MRRRLALLLCCLWIVLLSSCRSNIVTTPNPTPQPSSTAQTENKIAPPPPTQPASATDPNTQNLIPTSTHQPGQTSPTITPLITQPAHPPTPDGDIAQAQARLLELGYSEVGWVDGIFSDQTGAAISHFQYLNNLEISGLLETSTRAALDDPTAITYRLPPPFPGLVIDIGRDFGDDQALHARLAELGYIAFDESEWLSNQYGPATQEVVRRFQETSGLEPTGAVDLATWQALFSPWALPAEGLPRLLPPAPDAWDSSIYPVGENPFAIVSDGQRLWVAHRAEGSTLDNFILAIDPQAGAANMPVPIKVDEPWTSVQPIGGMAFAQDRLWLLFPNADNPSQGPFIRSMPIDTGALSERLEFATCPEGFCFPSTAFGYDGSFLWASAGDQVVGIDPSTSKPLESHQVGWLASGEILLANGCLWMAGEAGVTAFNPAGGQCPFAELAYALPGDALAFDGRRIWGASKEGGFINWLHLGTGELGNPIEVRGGPRALAYDGRRLWVAQEEANSLLAVDTDSGQISGSLPVCQGPVALRFGFMRLWVACAGSRTVQSIYYYRYFIDQGLSPLPASPTPAPTASSAPTTSAPNTATHTPTPAPPPLHRTLFLTSPRMQGDDILMLQKRLLELGYTEIGELDGIFGPQTEQAVKHFQEVNDLVVDGLVGPQTWAQLFSPAAKSP